MITHPVSAKKTYALAWLSLLGLLALTVGSAYLKLGWMNSVINLVIAVAKALLVMIFFMHLRSSHPMLRVVAVAGFLWLTLLIGLAFTDFATR
jgi:cytochrome c oxidase subunit IV